MKGLSSLKLLSLWKTEKEERRTNWSKMRHETWQMQQMFLEPLLHWKRKINLEKKWMKTVDWVVYFICSDFLIWMFTIKFCRRMSFQGDMPTELFSLYEMFCLQLALTWFRKRKKWKSTYKIFVFSGHTSENMGTQFMMLKSQSSFFSGRGTLICIQICANDSSPAQLCTFSVALLTWAGDRLGRA